MIMDCPLCGKYHEVTEKTRLATVMIKGEDVQYVEFYYDCPYVTTNDKVFMTGAMVNRNLLNARDAYRKEKGLLTSREIKMIRMENGLSQKEFAEMLGLDQEAIVR